MAKVKWGVPIPLPEDHVSDFSNVAFNAVDWVIHPDTIDPRDDPEYEPADDPNWEPEVPPHSIGKPRPVGKPKTR